ncbi:MAG: ATP-dependent DNA helicase [Defluviitaleaceae bacterium]|nr:ATP-dependent DNA helicase [Defluviitaleaceae bacterium]
MADGNIIKISVHKIVDLVLRCGDIDSRFNDDTSMHRGAAAHRKIQKEAGEGYKKEVSLALEAVIGGVAALVQGRADGIITAPDGSVTVDEIKSTTLLLDYLYKQHALHLGQGKCYAYMYLKSMDNPPPCMFVQLTYYQLDSGALERHRWEFSAAELEAFFSDLLQKYGMWLRFERDWKVERDASIEAAIFPFAAFRRGQREFAAAVYRAIASQKKLYAAAPTGIGKTVSALFPSIKAMGEGKAEKIFYLTAKTVTRAVAEDAVKLMATQGLRFKSVTLRAKHRICPNEMCICNPDFCTRARGHYDRLNEALWDILQIADLITPVEITEYAQKHSVCPHEYALAVSSWCDLVVGDYNHVFDPTAYLRRFFDTHEPRDYIFLIDEAHNLVDRVRDMYSVTLRKSALSKIRRQLKGKDALAKNVRKELRLINAYLTDVRGENENGGAVAEQDIVLKAFVSMLIQAIGDWLKANNGHALYGEMLDLYFETNMYLLVAELYDEHYTTLIETRGSDVSVTLFCLDPSAVIAQGLGRGVASVIFSATLTPLAYYREILGGAADDPVISLPSPFDPNRQEVIIHRGISTKYADRERSYAPIAETIHAVCGKRAGNYLVFFPSYAYMEKVHAVFCEAFPQVRTLLQRSDMTEEERAEYLTQFDAANLETLVGFAVLGGIFSEGIDLKGDRLIGSIIVSVGIPMINKRQDLIRDYFNEKNGQGYEYAYIFPGMNKVQQAAGRVIRTDTDAGVVVLIDSRFATEKYRRLFPPHWSNVRVVDATKEI